MEREELRNQGDITEQSQSYQQRVLEQLVFQLRKVNLDQTRRPSPNTVAKQKADLVQSNSPPGRQTAGHSGEDGRA